MSTYQHVNAINAGCPAWGLAEDAILEEGIKRAHSARHISARLARAGFRRSVHAVSNRRGIINERMGIVSRSRYLKAEDVIITAAVAEGKSDAEIVALLHAQGFLRSFESARSRRERLGLQYDNCASYRARGDELGFAKAMLAARSSGAEKFTIGVKRRFGTERVAVIRPATYVPSASCLA